MRDINNSRKQLSKDRTEVIETCLGNLADKNKWENQSFPTYKCWDNLFKLKTTFQIKIERRL